MDSQTLPITKVDFAWGYCQMLIVIQQLKTLGDISEKVILSYLYIELKSVFVVLACVPCIVVKDAGAYKEA